MSSVPKGATRSVGQFEKLAKVGEGTMSACTPVLSRRLSTATSHFGTCTPNKTYGCSDLDYPGSPRAAGVWVSKGCRGIFTCIRPTEAGGHDTSPPFQCGCPRNSQRCWRRDFCACPEHRLPPPPTNIK